jgi:hypothetical protein
MQNGRWNNPHQNFFTVDRSPSQDIGEKPTLWELHASHNEERWCNMRVRPRSRMSPIQVFNEQIAAYICVSRSHQITPYTTYTQTHSHSATTDLAAP